MTTHEYDPYTESIDENTENKTGTLRKICFLFFILIAICGVFFSGFFAHIFLTNEEAAKPPLPTPYPSQKPLPQISGEPISYAPGSHYFDEDVILVGKETPRISHADGIHSGDTFRMNGGTGEGEIIE